MMPSLITSVLLLQPAADRTAAQQQEVRLSIAELSDLLSACRDLQLKPGESFTGFDPKFRTITVSYTKATYHIAIKPLPTDGAKHEVLRFALAPTKLLALEPSPFGKIEPEEEHSKVLSLLTMALRVQRPKEVPVIPQAAKPGVQPRLPNFESVRNSTSVSPAIYEKLRELSARPVQGAQDIFIAPAKDVQARERGELDIFLRLPQPEGQREVFAGFRVQKTGELRDLGVHLQEGQDFLYWRHAPRPWHKSLALLVEELISSPGPNLPRVLGEEQVLSLGKLLGEFQRETQARHELEQGRGNRANSAVGKANAVPYWVQPAASGTGLVLVSLPVPGAKTSESPKFQTFRIGKAGTVEVSPVTHSSALFGTDFSGAFSQIILPKPSAEEFQRLKRFVLLREIASVVGDDLYRIPAALRGEDIMGRGRFICKEAMELHRTLTSRFESGELRNSASTFVLNVGEANWHVRNFPKTGSFVVSHIEPVTKQVRQCHVTADSFVSFTERENISDRDQAVAAKYWQEGINAGNVVRRELQEKRLEVSQDELKKLEAMLVNIKKPCCKVHGAGYGGEELHKYDTSNERLSLWTGENGKDFRLKLVQTTANGDETSYLTIYDRHGVRELWLSDALLDQGFAAVSLRLKYLQDTLKAQELKREMVIEGIEELSKLSHYNFDLEKAAKGIHKYQFVGERENEDIPPRYEVDVVKTYQVAKPKPFVQGEAEQDEVKEDKPIAWQVVIKYTAQEDEPNLRRGDSRYFTAIVAEGSITYNSARVVKELYYALHEAQNAAERAKRMK